MPWPVWSLEAVLHCQVCICDWSIEVCHYRGWELVSDSISVHQYGQCTHNIDNVFTTCTTATTQLLGIWWSVSYVLLFMTEYHWTAEQFQVDRALLSPPIRNHPSSNHTTAAPSQRYVERGYVCVYINCGHYSRLGDIKMFERLYNCVWCTFHMFLEINFMWLPVECHAHLCNCTWL